MPIAAALPAIIPAVGGMLGGLFGGGNKTINGTTGAETTGQNILNNLGQQQMSALGNGLDYAKQLSAFGSGFLGNAGDEYNKANTFLNSASNTFNPAADYYNAILSGNKAQMMGAMAPEITQINNAGNAAKNQLATMGPMGGGRASALAQLPMQTAGQIGTMFQQARPAAAQGMINVGNARAGLAGLTGQMAGQQGQIGAGLASNVLGGLLNTGNQAGTTGNDLLRYGLGRSQLNSQAGGQFGGGIYDILNSIGRTGVFGGPRSTPSFGPYAPQAPYEGSDTGD